MEMCKGDEILMELEITQLLLNYNSFLQDSEASITTWFISLLYYQCFLLHSLNCVDMDMSIVAEQEKSAKPHWESVLQTHPVCLHWAQRDAVVLHCWKS